MNFLLTKSKYLVGLECLRQLWIDIHEPEEKSTPSITEQFKYSEGSKVGEVATFLFPTGINISSENFSENLKKTKELLIKKVPLFEAGFKSQDLFSRADILVPVGEEWDIIEVKSGTNVKDINVHDVSFQKYVYEKCGLKIRKCFLMHLNNEYVLRGDLDIKALFIQEDITSNVNAVISNVEKRVREMIQVLCSEEPPKAGFLTQQLLKEGYHDCLTEGCVYLPDNNVFCLYRGGTKSKELFSKGIILIKDISKDVQLNKKQNIQRSCEVEGTVHVEKDNIKDFLNTLKYPIYCLDFETFSTGIPMFDGLKPYSQVPFQFSVCIVKNIGGAPQCQSFLYDGSDDPRKDFALSLKKLIGEKGTVLVYNKSFEIGRLKELAEFFPEHKEWIDNVLKRIVDLLVPFRDFHYYNSKQQGSASIKDVLPAITGKGYDGMEIGDGGTASTEFYRITYGDCSDEEKKKVRERLLKYCEMDTMAEVEIIETLKKLCT